MAAPVEASIFNQYSDMRIPEINRLGTWALQDCVVLELQARGHWEDPEVRWAYDFSMDMHSDERRKDGPYVNHILRTTIWAVRGFDTANPEIPKTALLHDVVENHPKRIVNELRNGRVSAGTDREQAFETLCNSGRLSQPNTLEAIGRLTCPSFKDCQPIERRQSYARRILDIALKQPLAAIAKSADQLDNGNGNVYNPDPKMQRRLDIKYYPLNAAYRAAIYLDGSLIPDHRKDFVDAAFEDGQRRAKVRLMQALPGVPGMSEAEVDALTLENLFKLRDAAKEKQPSMAR